MNGLLTVASKEFSDYVSSKRYWLLLAIIYVAGISTAYLGISALVKSQTEGSFILLFTVSSSSLPAFLFFTAYLGPLLGIAIGFDSVNRETSKGTLVRVLSQPIYRDSVINGKFISGIAIIAITITGIVGIAAGMAIRIGLVPNMDEIIRIFVFIIFTTLYIALWLAISQFLSILFKQSSTSAIGSFAIWGFFSFFWPTIASLMAGSFVQDSSLEVERAIVEQNLSRLSPVTLYLEAVIAVLRPVARLISFDPVALEQLMYAIPNPLPLSQSLLLIWPQITVLIALLLLCFLASYLRFMKQEIRA